MDCIVHGVTKSQTQLGDFHFSLLFMTLSLHPFRIFFLASAILIMIYVGMDLFGFIFSGALYTSSTWISVSFFRFRMFSPIISPNTFLTLFCLFFFWDLCYVNVGTIDVVPEVP
ncbi:unnamed protein product [Rangifer tarandus platyrhynchus]|uniref:Uncharacterized protein n=2 Tax=Rangifer tarandus platyrhynchus TaxID=3082113 RepID=A0AC59ZTT9_RANTA|nr:unnamed protein product [Rangifer tarandus platyrhynchus]